MFPDQRRAVPSELAKWNRRSIDEVVAYIDGASPDPDQFETTRAMVRTASTG